MAIIKLPPLQFANRSYPVVLSLRKNNRRLRLSIDSGGQIRLSAPLRTRQSQLLDFLHTHQDWIRRQLQNMPENPHSYQTDSEQDFLGASIRLQAFVGRGSDLSGTILRLGVNNLDEESIAAALQAWYRQQAQMRLPIYLAKVLPLCPWVETVPPIRIRRMRRQWGNCAHKGHLTFNTHLIKAAPELIEHVIVHELCHLKEFNHSPRFYALMHSVDPDWQDKAQRLNALTRRYIR